MVRAPSCCCQTSAEELALAARLLDDRLVELEYPPGMVRPVRHATYNIIAFMSFSLVREFYMVNFCNHVTHKIILDRQLIK